MATQDGKAWPFTVEAMTAKLETEADVLEWACITAQDQEWCACNRCVNIRADRATAAEIARAVRLLRAFEEMEHMGGSAGDPPGEAGFDRVWGEEEGQAAGWNACINTLRAALEEPPTR